MRPRRLLLGRARRERVTERKELRRLFMEESGDTRDSSEGQKRRRMGTKSDTIRLCACMLAVRGSVT